MSFDWYQILRVADGKANFGSSASAKKLPPKRILKGIVQPFKTGVMGGIIRLAFKFSSFLQFFKLFLKDPRLLNRKKRIRAVKQLSLGQVTIMWRPLQNAL
jgi:hypothetical protein